MTRLRAYNKTLGSYMPAFFHMEVGFPFYTSPVMLYKLSPQDLSTFIHEYIHFLQDISSLCLLNNAYVYTEYMHSAANCIYKLPKGEFDIPLAIPYNYGNLDLNRFINGMCMGEFESQDSIFITNIKFKQHKVPIKNDIVNILPIPYLQLANGTELKFGTCAIMESMAYLMERHITKGSKTPPEYPYQTALAVAFKEYEAFAQDDLNVIALCDLSLQFANPGKIFVQTLREMKEQQYLPTKPEELYDNLYQKPCTMMGRDSTLPISLIEMCIMVQNRLKLYLNDKMFYRFHNTIRDFIGFGIESRLRNPHFMIDIVRDGYALQNPTLLRIMNRVGSPLIIDSARNFTHIPPAGQSANDSLPIFLGIEQIYKCFSEGYTMCELYEFCEATKSNAQELFGDDYLNQEPILDDNCWQSPWNKVTDVRLCPYALLWKHWKLSDWRPKIKVHV